MHLRICVPSAFPEQFMKFCRSTVTKMTGKADLFVCGNGWTEADVERIRERTYPLGPPYDSWDELEFQGHVHLNSVWRLHENGGMQQGLQSLYLRVRKDLDFFSPREGVGYPDGNDDIIAFLHDDLYIHEVGWDTKVLQAFAEHPKVGLIGFGGSTQLGGDEIYKVPYEIHQLGRRDFWSNMRGAEVHGKRTTTAMPIVYTDGFSMIVRRSLLDKIDGWSWLPSESVAYAYDYGLACQVRRHGWEALLLPLDVEHGDAKGMGGITRESEMHVKMAEKYGGGDHVHETVHRFIYDTFRDVLPLRLPR